MSGTRAKFRGAFTQVAQQVGIPVDGFVQDFNNLMEVLKVSLYCTRECFDLYPMLIFAS
jgi:hypothetical protein